MRRLVAIVAVLVALTGGYLTAAAVAWAGATQVDGACMELHADQAPATFRATWGSAAAGDAVEVDAAPYRFDGAAEVSFPSLTPGISLGAWWAPSDDPRAGAVIVVHGRNSCRHDPAVLLPAGMVRAAGLGVLVVDLRDHGTSDPADGHWAGGADEWQDVLGAWQWLRGRGYPAASIGLLGLSMGAGAVAFAFGREPAVAAAWLDSPYADFLSMSLEVAGDPVRRALVPGALLMSTVLGGGDFLGSSPERVFEGGLGGRPVAIVHGDRDATIPVEQGIRLAAAATRGGSAVEPWIVAGAGHVESAFLEPAAYAARVAAFFRAGLLPMAS